MMFWLYSFLISAGLLLMLSLLLIAEHNRGQRLFLAGFRSLLDRLFTYLRIKIGGALHFVSGKVVRLTLHFFVHQALALLLRTLRFLENHLTKLQWRNRISARRIRLSEYKNHLDLIAEHKEEHALTERQKQRLKERSITG